MRPAVGSNENPQYASLPAVVPTGEVPEKVIMQSTEAMIDIRHSEVARWIMEEGLEKGLGWHHAWSRSRKKNLFITVWWEF